MKAQRPNILKKPFNYINNLIIQKGDDSLLDTLQKKNLAKRM